MDTMGRNVSVDGYQVAEPLKGEANVPGPQAELVTARVRSEPARSLQRRVNALTLSNPDSNPASEERRIWHRRYHQMQGRRRLSRMRGVSNGVPRDRLDGLATAGRPELPRIRSLSWKHRQVTKPFVIAQSEEPKLGVHSAACIGQDRCKAIAQGIRARVYAYGTNLCLPIIRPS